MKFNKVSLSTALPFIATLLTPGCIETTKSFEERAQEHPNAKQAAAHIEVLERRMEYIASICEKVLAQGQTFIRSEDGTLQGYDSTNPERKIVCTSSETPTPTLEAVEHQREERVQIDIKSHVSLDNGDSKEPLIISGGAFTQVWGKSPTGLHLEDEGSTGDFYEGIKFKKGRLVESEMEKSEEVAQHGFVPGIDWETEREKRLTKFGETKKEKRTTALHTRDSIEERKERIRLWMQKTRDALDKREAEFSKSKGSSPAEGSELRGPTDQRFMIRRGLR